MTTPTIKISNTLSSGNLARAIITNQKSASELVIMVKKEFEESNFVHNGYAGLCDCIHAMFQQKVISGSEYSKIYEFLSENRPESTKSTSGYWWKAYDKESRLEFLESLVKVDKN